MTTRDQNFNILTTGQANWDTDLNTNTNYSERGYYITERAGQAISSGQVLWLNSGGFFLPYNSASASIFPHAYAYVGASSGDTMQALAWGIVRSLGVNSPLYPGQLAFANGSGFISAATAGLAVGYGCVGFGVLFNPAKASGGGAGGSTTLGGLTDVNTNGVTQDSLLKWSNASSKWIVAVDSYIVGAVSYVTTLTAATAINTGHAIWIDPNSAAVGKHFDPNSESTLPSGIALTGGTGAGSIFQLVSGGYLNGLAITSAAPVGSRVYVSALTPGVLVGSYAASNRPVGRCVGSQSILVDPFAIDRFPEQIVGSVSIAAVTGSLHIFNMSGGRWGWNRQTTMLSNSANLVELKFYSNSAHTALLYSTISGGVTTVNSFIDNAGWPYTNTDASTLGDLVYGTLKIMSAAAVGSNTISIQQVWDRSR